MPRSITRAPEWLDLGPCAALSIEGDSEATAIFLPGARGAGAQALLAYRSSLAAGVAASRALRAVWYTPLLTDERVVADLERATVPLLLVGGTADPAWDRSVAHALSVEVAEFDGADHTLSLARNPEGSHAVLRDAVTRAATFVGAPR